MAENKNIQQECSQTPVKSQLVGVTIRCGPIKLGPRLSFEITTLAPQTKELAVQRKD